MNETCVIKKNRNEIFIFTFWMVQTVITAIYIWFLSKKGNVTLSILNANNSSTTLVGAGLGFVTTVIMFLLVIKLKNHDLNSMMGENIRLIVTNTFAALFSYVCVYIVDSIIFKNYLLMAGAMFLDVVILVFFFNLLNPILKKLFVKDIE